MPEIPHLETFCKAARFRQGKPINMSDGTRLFSVQGRRVLALAGGVQFRLG